MSLPSNPPEALQKLDQAIAKLLLERFELQKSIPASDAFNVSNLVSQQGFLGTPAGKELAEKLHPQAAAALTRIISQIGLFEKSDQPTVAFLGPAFSYSYLATVRYFSELADLRPVATIATVFDDVLAGRCAFGVVPIENSTDGRVVDTLASFADSPLGICGEVLYPIHHCLLTHSAIEKIECVYSKPQAISQCRKWLATHLPGVKTLDVSSTTAAAEIASREPKSAAIASFEAGLHFGLKSVANRIEDVIGNVTRFAVVGRNKPPATGADKTSLMLQIRHRSGALADAMQIFRAHSINLTWIESFPLRGNPNEYLFFIELDGHQANEQVSAALDQLKEQTLRFECLGSYPKAKLVDA